MSESSFIYIVYKTTNLINNKIYVGVHHQINNEFDGYVGSGKALIRAIKKYQKEKFNRETLFAYDNPEEAYSKEAEIVNEEFIKRADTYNIRLGGFGCSPHSEESKLIMSERRSNKPFKPRSEEAKIKQSITMKGRYLGKKLTQEHKDKIGESSKGRIPSLQSRLKSSERLKGIPRSEMAKQNMKGKLRSEEGKQNISIASIKRCSIKFECPHCHKLIDKSNARRWHFDNCKFK